MRTLCLLFLLASCTIHAADQAGAVFAKAPRASEGFSRISDDCFIIDSLDRMRKPPYDYFFNGTQPAEAVTWFHDKIVAGVNREVILYDTDGRVVNTSGEKKDKIAALASGGDKVAVGYGTNVKICDPRVDNSEEPLPGENSILGQIKSLSMSDDGNVLAVGGITYDDILKKNNNITLLVYDLREQKSLARYYKVPGLITRVEVSPDGKKIAIANGCQVDYGDIGSALQIRAGSKKPNKDHSLVQAVCFTKDGGLYSGDNLGLLVDPMDKETKYYPTSDKGEPIDGLERPWISGLAYRAGGLWVLANTPYVSRDNVAPVVTRKKEKNHPYFDLGGYHLGACAANKAGDLALVGSHILLIKNKE